MLIDFEGREYTYALRFEFETTNNEVEYEALLAGLRIAQEMEIAKVAIFLDSQRLAFEECTVEHVRRNQNKKADALSNLASMTFEHLTKEVLVEVLTKRFGVPRIISSKEEKLFKEGMFADLCKGLKVTQSFSPVIEHMEIMHRIERQITQSQQGWVDNLAKTLWIHRTLPRNSQKETPFSLTYGSEAMIPIIKTTDDRGRVQKETKGKESKEVASIENAYYQNKL
ncbi:reverse transcriptase domain-containing protein [Tanacetum coccineum]|uniref:Reverse transcriptase domain-containing protein n=1 Tax=Tanacetum coccineum TaxID=301880 RepID=A0ABQ5BTH8_9ASTR